MKTDRKPRRRALKKYSAKLLFQYRVVSHGKPNRKRLCEERIIRFEARSASSALAHARRYGRGSGLKYLNAYGDAVHLEFVGVMDLVCCGKECDPEEVWYEVKELVLPMERRDRLIPPEDQLCAIRYDV